MVGTSNLGSWNGHWIFVSFISRNYIEKFRYLHGIYHRFLMIVSTQKRWPPWLPLVLSEAKALMAFMNGLAGEAVGWNPSFFSVQYGEVGFIHWGERTTIYKNDSRDESASRNYESIVDSTWEIRVFIHSNLRWSWNGGKHEARSSGTWSITRTEQKKRWRCHWK